MAPFLDHFTAQLGGDRHVLMISDPYLHLSSHQNPSVFPWVCLAMTTPNCPVLHVSSQLLSTQWFCNFKDLCRQSFSWSGSFLETFGHRPKQKNEGICQEVRCRKFCTQSWTHMNTHYSYIIVISPQSCQKLTKLCAPT